MILKRVLILCLLLLSLLEPFCAGREAIALDECYRRSFLRQLKFIASKKPQYSWGGSSDLSKGLDCSGYIFLAAKWAGLPGIVRTTSARMALGLGGWIGYEIDRERASECDLVFWTLSELRPDGHVGAVTGAAKGYLEIAHASQSRGVIQQRMSPCLQNRISRVRKLTIGDPVR